MAGIAAYVPCPACGLDGQSAVILTRRVDAGTLRRHACRCGHRWWTLQAPPVALEAWRVSWCRDVASVAPEVEA